MGKLHTNNGADLPYIKKVLKKKKKTSNKNICKSNENFGKEQKEMVEKI